MEKLIELLNEYDEGGNWRKVHWIGLGCEDHDTIGYKNKTLSCEQDEIISYLISKSYGFIKWLVDNDKIELHELSKKELATGWSLENNILDEKNTKESWIKFWTENLLMILAISDNPIDFLCEIIKK